MTIAPRILTFRAAPALLVALLFGLSSAPPASTMAPVHSVQEATTAELERRWADLSQEQREKLRARYERLMAMDADERATILARGRRLAELERELMRELTSVQRAELEALDAEARRAVVREMLADEARAAAERIHARLTPEERTRLQNATPEQRRRILRELRAEQDRALPARLNRIGRELGLGDAELRRLARLPKEEQRGSLMELARRRAVRWVQAFGLPDGVTRAQWDAWKELPDRDFARVLSRLRHRDPSFAVPPRQAGRVGQAGQDGRPNAAHRMKRRADEAVVRELRRALVPEPAERIELARLSTFERRRVLAERQRARLMEILRRQSELPPGFLVRLESLSDDAFFAAVLDGVQKRFGTRLQMPRWMQGQNSERPQRGSQRGNQTGDQMGNPRGAERGTGRGTGRGTERGPDRGPSCGGG